MGGLLLYENAVLCLKRINKEKKGLFNTARFPMRHYQTYWEILPADKTKYVNRINQPLQLIPNR